MKKRDNHELYVTAGGLAKTFVNRQDYFAIQSDNGQYYSVKDELTVNHIMRHLKGQITLGVYLLGLDGIAKFTVIDADDDEGFEKLINVQETLPLPSYMESSRRGGHLLFFLTNLLKE